MREGNEGPRGGPMVWLMAIIVICLAARIDTITADVILLSLTAYAVTIHSRS